jgi:hypothetical protein
MLRQFIDTCKRDFKNHGWIGPIKTARSSIKFSIDEIRYQFTHKSDAVNIYDRKWDLLILLDCATIDMMEEVADEYDFIGDIGEHVSPGTCSNEWMRRTFTSEYRHEMERTLHITANTSSERYLRSDQFLHLDEVWRDGWSEELGTIPAREVTDRAIWFARKYDAERMIIHYMQPHTPFVDNDMNSNVVSPVGTEGEGLQLEELYNEGYSRQELWDASVENLRYVLDDVELLLSSIDADRVVISSDHGQAFGEKGVWQHPCRTYIDVLTDVPWCVTSASNSSDYEPDYEPADQHEDDISLDEKLAALGYK